MIKRFEELFIPPFSAHILYNQLIVYLSLYCGCGLLYERAVIHCITAVLVELIFCPINLIGESDISLLPECAAIHNKSFARKSECRTLHLHWPFPVGCINTHCAVIAHNAIPCSSILLMQLVHNTFRASLTVFNPCNIIILAHIAVKAICTLEGQCATSFT